MQLSRIVIAACIGGAGCSSEAGGATARTTTDAGSQELGIPCAVQAALAAKCLRCHGEPVQLAAPYQFLTIEQLRETRGDRPVYERIAAAVEADFMPPLGVDLQPPVEPLTGPERATLVEWAAAGGMPELRATCD